MNISAINTFSNMSAYQRQNFNGKFVFENVDSNWDEDSRTSTRTSYYSYIPSKGESKSKAQLAIDTFIREHEHNDYDSNNKINYKYEVAVSLKHRRK